MRIPFSVALGLAVVALGLAGCGSTPAPSPSLDPLLATACELAPVARQVAVDLRSAVAASIRGDETAMTRAADQARANGSQITMSVSALGPQPSTDALVGELVSIGLFGDQGGSFFADGIPDAQELASLQRNLPVLDQTLSRLQAELADAGLQAC